MNLKTRKELYDICPLLPDVLQYAVAEQIISVTSIQRKFRIGYPRAAKIMDILVEEGFVENGGYPRKVLLSHEDYIDFYGGDLPKLREEDYSRAPRPRKGMVKTGDLHLDEIKYFDEFDVPVDEKTQKQLSKMVHGILFDEAIINLSSDSMLRFLKEKEYKVKFIKLNLDNISGIFRAVDKIVSPIIYIIDVADGSIMEILEQSNLLVKEGAVVMRKINAKQSTLTILY